jgi:hypothetical protein
MSFGIQRHGVRSKLSDVSKEHRLPVWGREIGQAKKLTFLATCFHAGFLPTLILNPEDRGEMYLRNVS